MSDVFFKSVAVERMCQAGVPAQIATLAYDVTEQAMRELLLAGQPVRMHGFLRLSTKWYMRSFKSFEQVEYPPQAVVQVTAKMAPAFRKKLHNARG